MARLMIKQLRHRRIACHAGHGESGKDVFQFGETPPSFVLCGFNHLLEIVDAEFTQAEPRYDGSRSAHSPRPARSTGASAATSGAAGASAAAGGAAGASSRRSAATCTSLLSFALRRRAMHGRHVAGEMHWQAESSITFRALVTALGHGCRLLRKDGQFPSRCLFSAPGRNANRLAGDCEAPFLHTLLTDTKQSLCSDVAGIGGSVSGKSRESTWLAIWWAKGGIRGTISGPRKSRNCRAGMTWHQFPISTPSWPFIQ